MKKFCFVFLTILFCASIVCSAQTIELRSDRSAKAEITEDKAKQNYAVKINFVPVTTLDDVTNEEMTVMLAQFFTEEALSIFLKDSKAVIFSGVHPNVLKKDKGIISILYTIPFSKICKAEKSSKTSTAEAMLKKFYSWAQISSDELLANFRSTCFRDLRSAEIFFVSQIAETKDQALMEKKVRQAFLVLTAKINNDDALFMSEKEELLEKAKKIESFLLKRLHSAPAASQADQTATAAIPQSISKATFLPEFKDFLINDNILLEVGGCRAFENASGKLALIAVGVALVKDNSPKDRLMCQKIAEQKAFGELAKHQEVEVNFFAERYKSTEVKTENGAESGKSRRNSTSRITVQAEAYFSKMITVGYWYSGDGKLFFLAKGCFIDHRDEIK